MDPKKNTNDKAIITLPEVHTSVEEAKKAEEIARQERIQDHRAEKHAHQEANVVKNAIEKELKELENKKNE
ncbi:unnamed protein product [Rhizophagus irregularis]|uniref:Uncharacterized protein n=4 Tax=Rhizophagus irregularis TaxID=588596 RepID=A0A2I1DV62_9GLOM|nr:hypothetical protein RirG_176240 [Rhizophagus irregularis DAOM 197198w]PKK81029.1 hypothetical protein RhiirC2_722969 [Rhizophagus irregularis]GBC20116.1 hypothetical protein RIR_jg37337.t1 [Rhizophagus irregularis DAOM 181602=DAOM 197198]PKY13772.1 hypothetical protein RhiirB3_399383 [Rhizophagus irregularis]CAB4374228.1 unnamed protein product [Rhizophagus irregularis]